MVNSDTVTYRAVVTATKVDQNRPDSWYDSQFNTYLLHYPMDQYHLRVRADQERDKDSVGKTETMTFGDHTKPSTVKAQITKHFGGRPNFNIDEVKWYKSKVEWEEVDL